MVCVCVCVCCTGVKLDNPSCEVLETVLSRVHTNSLDLEKANLEDEVERGRGSIILGAGLDIVLIGIYMYMITPACTFILSTRFLYNTGY